VFRTRSASVSPRGSVGMLTTFVSTSDPGLSLFIPFYNERESLPRAVESVLDALSGHEDGFELVLVDDGSRDGSGKYADEVAARHSAVRVVRHEVNRGYGPAVCAGFASCRGAIVAYTDADLPVNPRCFVDALDRMDGVDVLLGYPRKYVQRRHRRLYTAGYNLLMRLMFGVRVRNINFSFKLLRRHVIEELPLDAESGFVDAQIVVEAHRSGARIEEMGVDYQERQAGVSHFDSPLAAVPTGREALSWWLRTR